MRTALSLLFAWAAAAAAPLGAQTSIDIRSQAIRALGSVGAVCTQIGPDVSGRRDGFHGPNNAAELASGTLFVANVGTSEILQLDRQGRYQRVAMQAGAGPGELSTPHSQYEVLAILVYRYRGDSVLVFDAKYRRVSILAPSGNFARDFSLADNQRVGSEARVVGVSASDGSLVLIESSRARALAGQRTPVDQDSLTIVRIGPEGRHIWSLSGVEDTKRPLPISVISGARGNGEGMRTIRSRPASPLQRLGTLAVTGTTVAHYAERTNELVWYGASAQPIRRVMLPPMPVPVLGDKPAPASLMVHSDADDRVWVEVPRALRDSPRVWWVLTRDGQLLGSVTTPPLQQLLQIGSDFVLLRAQDSDGVAFIRRCALPVMR